MKTFEQYKYAFDWLSRADTYTEEYLKIGGSCDSSTGQEFHMSFIKKAMQSEEVKKLTIKVACEMLLGEIGAQADICKTRSEAFSAFYNENKDTGQ